MNAKMTRMTGLLLAGGLVLTSAGLALADLRSKLPAESIAYVEFTGADASRDAFKLTPVGKIMIEPDMQKTASALVAALDAFVMQQAVQDGTPPEIAQQVRTAAGILWRRGFALDVLDIGMGPAGPTVSAILLVDAGPEVDALRAAHEQLLAGSGLPPAADELLEGRTFRVLPPLGPGAPPVRYGVVDGLFVVLLGESTPLRFLASLGGSAPALSASPSLNAALDKTGAGASPYALLVHLDAGQSLAQLRTVFGGMSGGTGFPPPVEQFLTASGLGEVKGLTIVSQIADGAFRHAVFAACPSPRQGVLRLIDQTPLTDDDLLWVPQDALFASVANVNIVGGYDAIMELLATMSGSMEDINSVVAQVEAALKLRLRDDLLASFGDGLALFDGPSQGGFFLTGMALVVETPDEAAAQKALRTLADSASKWLTEEMDVPAGLQTTTLGGHEIHYFTFPGLPIPVTPAWAILNQHVVFGLAPQTVKLTLDRVGGSDAAAKSILANKDFQRGRKLLPPKLVQLSYVDTATTMRRAYPFALMLASAGIQAAAPYAPAVDVAAFPGVNQFADPFFGDVIGVAVDDDGVLEVFHGPLPLPGASMLTSNVNSTALALSILVPSLSRARELSKRTVSMSNLRQLGVACMIYANDHEEKFPADLAALLSEGIISSPKQFVSPLHGGPEPSYTYISGHTLNSAPHWVVAHEDYPGMAAMEGAAVLFADGHVEFVQPVERVTELVTRTHQEMAERADK